MNEQTEITKQKLCRCKCGCKNPVENPAHDMCNSCLAVLKQNGVKAKSSLRWRLRGP